MPGRLREAVGIGKEVVVVGVYDRMEIWDKATYERYEQAYAARTRPEASNRARAPEGEPLRWGGPESRRPRKDGTVNDDRRKLAAEVRQSLSLIGMTIADAERSIAFGVMVGQLG